MVSAYPQLTSCHFLHQDHSKLERLDPQRLILEKGTNKPLQATQTSLNGSLLCRTIGLNPPAVSKVWSHLLVLKKLPQCILLQFGPCCWCCQPNVKGNNVTVPVYSRSHLSKGGSTNKSKKAIEYTMSRQLVSGADASVG